MPVVNTMVGEVDAGDLDYGDEEAQIEKVKTSPNDGGSDNIRVAVRVRPPNKREQSGSGGGVCVKVSEGAVRVDRQPFAFDVTFPMECTQLEVFESIGVDIVQCAFHGYNAALFAYGQTSSGKSFSMMGVRGTALVGIIPRIARLLFKSIQSDDSKQVLVETSYMEIYNEKLRDLLGDPESTTELKVRENKQLGVHVAGLTKETCTCEEDTIATIEHGTKHRTTAATLYNSESSRSHAVFEISMQSKFFVSGTEMRATSRVALIDLAGSERSDKLGSKGAALKEGNNINKSLTVLGRCIRALVEVAKGKKTAVPFRESVLTWYLRDSLSGNARTTMLAACSPVKSNMEETLSTLRYADSAKSIKTKAVKNEDPAQAKIRELNAELEQLKRRLEEAEQDGSGRGARYSIADANTQQMTSEEKADLLQELSRQMEMLGDGMLVSSPSSRPNQRTSSLVYAGHQNAAKYPMLTCLSKDSMLNHAMAIAITKDNFSIGRSNNSHTNGFELDGMGIQARHCSFTAPAGYQFNVQGFDDENGDKCLTLKLLSSQAAVYVNGVALHEMEEEELDENDPTPKVDLHHLDRIVLGPCRLVCLYLTQPMTSADKEFWNYDACFTELSMRGKSSTLSLLPTPRRMFLNHLAEVEAEQIIQANTISKEMACNVRFTCVAVIQGQEGLDQLEFSLDDYLDLNQPKLQVKCVVDTALPIITSVKDMAASNSSVPARMLRKKSVKLSTDASKEANSLITLWSIDVDEFQDILVDLKAAHSSFMKLAGGLSGEDEEEAIITSTNSSSHGKTSGGGGGGGGSSSVFKAVFDSVDTDKSGAIDKFELEAAINIFNHMGDPNFLNLVWHEQDLADDLLFDYGDFESFLIKFLQRQFYKCIEEYVTVTNREKFVEIGGRDVSAISKHSSGSISTGGAGAGAGGNGSGKDFFQELSHINLHRGSIATSTDQEEGASAVKQFLHRANLSKYYSPLLAIGVDNMTDLLDGTLLGDGELKECGMSDQDISSFRDHVIRHRNSNQLSLESLLNEFGLKQEYKALMKMDICSPKSGSGAVLSFEDEANKAMAQESLLVHMLATVREKALQQAKKTAQADLKAKIQKRRASMATF